jgi:hypothetical protein
MHVLVVFEEGKERGKEAHSLGVVEVGEGSVVAYDPAGEGLCAISNNLGESHPIRRYRLFSLRSCGVGLTADLKTDEDQRSDDSGRAGNLAQQGERFQCHAGGSTEPGYHESCSCALCQLSTQGRHLGIGFVFN